MTIFLTILQVLTGIAIVIIVLFQSGKRSGLSGAIGGGGLGNIAIMIGYNRYKYAVLYAAVIVLVVLVQVIQSFGTWLATKSDKRLKK